MDSPAFKHRSKPFFRFGAMIALSIGAVLAFAWSAAADTLQTPGSNITVSACDPHRHTPNESHAWIDPYGRMHGAGSFPYYDGFLLVEYTNDSKKTATEVDFGLQVRQSLVAVAKDVGSFTTGVKINHEFVIPGEVFPLGTAFPACTVLRVKYSDGSEWRNPNPPPTG